MENFLICTNFSSLEFSKIFRSYKEENLYFYTTENFQNKDIPVSEMYVLQTTGNPFQDNILFFRLREFITENKISAYLIFPTDLTQNKIFWKGYIKEGNIRELPKEEELKFNLPLNFSIGKFVRMNIGKILVCSLAIGEEYKKIVEKGILCKKMYCLQHDYDYRDDEDVYDSSRPIAWSKILLLLKYLCNTDYDYIVWLDADTYIMNPDKTIEDIIQECSGGSEILASKDVGEINTGVMFIKNSRWSRDFFQRVWDSTEFINSADWEQDAFIHLYNSDYNQAKKHVRIISNQKVFNSFWYQYEPEDFILHFAGCSRYDTFNGLEYYMKQCCPFRLKNETYEQFQKRLVFQKQLVQVNLENQKREKEKREKLT